MRLSLVTLALLQPVYPEITELAEFPHTTVTTYVVTGRDARGVREDMNRLRPADPTGTRHDAVMSGQWNSTVDSGPDGRCDPTTAVVTIAIQVTMPELASDTRLSRSERQAWDRYHRALTLHEGNHVRIGLAGRDRLEAAMRGAPDCGYFQAISDLVSGEIAEAQADYDRSTRHGRTEGAQFP